MTLINSNLVKTILVSGHAKFPAASAARAVFEICTVTVEVDINQWQAVSVDCTLITDTAKKFIRKIIMNQKLTNDGINNVKKEIESRYFGYAKKTILAALLDLETNLENAKKHL